MAGEISSVKRVNHLLTQTIAYQNLNAAFRQAMRGCGKTAESCRFFYHLEPELLRLREELSSGGYSPSPYRFFQIFDPKERTIAEAPFRDRVVHHAIVNVLTPVYERVFIYDSYATRPGKGTHAAIRRAQQFLRAYRWYFKTDIDKYFDHVNHDIMLAILARKIKDRQFLALLEKIIRNTPAAGAGLPIGNLTSQFLANVYLDPLDHYLKDRRGIKGYIRYMDDMVIFAHEKTPLLDIETEIREFLAEKLLLRLKDKATLLNRGSHGLSFLGMRIFAGIIRVKPKNRRRCLQRMKLKENEWQSGLISETALADSITSTVGHLRYFCPRVRIPI